MNFNSLIPELSVSNVKKLYDDLKNKNIKFFKDLEVHNYKVDDVVYEDMEFLIQDVDGYLLRFNNKKNLL